MVRSYNIDRINSRRNIGKTSLGWHGIVRYDCQTSNEDFKDTYKKIRIQALTANKIQRTSFRIGSETTSSMNFAVQSCLLTKNGWTKIANIFKKIIAFTQYYEKHQSKTLQTNKQRHKQAKRLQAWFSLIGPGILPDYLI